VSSANNKLVFGISVALVGWVVFQQYRSQLAPPIQAQEPQTLEPKARVVVYEKRDYGIDYANFVADLGKYRAGDDAVLASLRLGAALLSEWHARPDAVRAVEYYAGLSASERRSGQDAYDEFVGLWGGVSEYTATGWDEDLVTYLDELRQFVARTLPAADFVPAGRALALAADIEITWVEYLRTVDDLRDDVLASATRNLRESIAIFERAGMLTPQLHPMWLQGRLEILSGREAQAKERFTRCAELATQTRVEDYRERSILRLIRMARDEGNAPRVRELLEELAQFRTADETWELTREYAVLLIHQDEPERAAEFLIRNRPREVTDLNSWRFAMAIARMRMGEFDASRELLKKMPAEGKHQDSLLLRATLDLAQGDPGSVLAALDLPKSELPRFGERGLSRAQVLIGEAHLMEGRAQAALDALAYAREIADRWEARLEEQSSLETTSATVMGEWLGLHSVVLEARALFALQRPLDAALLIERAHSAHWRTETLGAETLGALDLRAWAAPYAHGLITWISGADSGLAIHISSQGIATGIEFDTSRRELQRAARRLRGALLCADAEGVTRISSELSDVLFPEALKRSLQDSAEPDGRLLCLAHGEIERLALEAIELDGLTLDQRAALLILPGLPAKRPGLPAQTPGRWRLLGAPLDVDGIERLPAAREELDELRDLLPEAQTFGEHDFDRRSLVEALESGDSLHIATHLGTSESCDSERFAAVGLELSGGSLLCASDIALIETSAALVVLAACETAEGRQLDGRGLQGVSRALLDSGARDLLVTLWPVRDDIARQFTPLFHAALISGMGPARSARQARRQLAQNGVSAADWAAFRVIGRD
jgi:hypothetical protein